MPKKKKPLLIVTRIIGIILLILGLFYLFAPHTLHTSMKLDFGMEHFRHVAFGGILLVLGSILSLNGRRLMQGFYIKGIKAKNISPTLKIFIGIITLLIFYFFFNSLYELLSGDVNDFKILTMKISSVGVAVLLLLGMIKAKTVFTIKSTRY